MDYNINVRLRTHSRSKSTSTKGTTDKKKSITSAGSGVSRKTSKSGLGGSVKNLGGMKKAMGALPAVGAIMAVKKVLTAGAQVNINVGAMVTNNRYRQQRSQDTLNMVSNPVKMGTEMLKYNVTRHFEVMRENQRVEYNIRRSGNSIPNRSGNGGVTL